MKIVVSPKGRVIIPAAIRKKYGLKPGTRLRIVDHGRVLTLVPINDDPVGVGTDVLQSGDLPSVASMEEARKEQKPN